MSLYTLFFGRNYNGFSCVSMEAKRFRLVLLASPKDNNFSWMSGYNIESMHFLFHATVILIALQDAITVKSLHVVSPSLLRKKEKILKDKSSMLSAT